jgi:glycosyltransferase involved in cell wall biosynthesis
MSDSTVRGLTSIIIPCWNQVGFTQQCIAALKSHTRPPWELIAVDNGSTDATGKYLAEMRDLAGVPVTVVTNAANLGFPAAINQGLQLARGEYLVLLNNDVVVTDAWLDQLIASAGARKDIAAEHTETKTEEKRLLCRRELAELSDRRNLRVINLAAIGEESVADGRDVCREDSLPKSRSADGPSLPTAGAIGLVGPMSNYAAPPQLVEGLGYREMSEMPGLARRWRDEHRGRWFTVPKLSGFCLLMKRVVYEKVGGLDERFGLGFFDDDDLAERARRAGFELAVAHDLFVHHFGSRTFAGNGIEAGKLLDENGRRFAEKWGLAGTGGRRVELRPFIDGRSQNLDSRCKIPDSKATEVGGHCGAISLPISDAEKARVSLTVIVRDEEKNLANCLESVRGVFDEIVIVDTGSADRTIEIALSFGARVFEFAWVDSFSAARNEALSHATGDFAFWLDADDVVGPAEKEKLCALLGPLRASDQAGYVVRVILAPTGSGARRSSITSGCFHCARTCAGRTVFMSRSCPHCGRRLCRCVGLIRLCGIPGMLMLPCEAGSWSVISGCSTSICKTIRMIRSFCSIWGPSPLSAASGTRHSGFSTGAWRSRRRPTRSCASCLP